MRWAEKLQEIGIVLFPDCSVLISVYFLEVIFFDQINSFLFGYLLHLLEVIVALFVDHLSEVRLNLQPLVVFNDYHSLYYSPDDPYPFAPLSVFSSVLTNSNSIGRVKPSLI